MEFKKSILKYCIISLNYVQTNLAKQFKALSAHYPASSELYEYLGLLKYFCPLAEEYGSSILPMQHAS